jgi:hypothetical protein
MKRDDRIPIQMLNTKYEGVSNYMTKEEKAMEREVIVKDTPRKACKTKSDLGVGRG